MRAKNIERVKAIRPLLMFISLLRLSPPRIDGSDSRTLPRICNQTEFLTLLSEFWIVPGKRHNRRSQVLGSNLDGCGQTGAVAPGQLRSGSSFRHTWSTSSRNVFAAAAPMTWTFAATRTWNYHLENLSKDRKITRWELKYHSAAAKKDPVEECGLCLAKRTATP